MAGSKSGAMPRIDRDMTGEMPSVLTEEEWARLAEKMDPIFGPELGKILREQLDSTKADWGFCKKHGLKVLCDRPDRANILKAVQLIVSYLKGTPVQRKEIDFKAKIEHTRREIREMSDAELLELAAAEEAEWTPAKSLPAGN